MLKLRKDARPILVTGAHRSGSTWFGQMLCQASGLRYVDEPFNINLHREHCPLAYWFEYFHEGHPEEEAVLAYVQSFYHLKPEWLRRKILEIRSYLDLKIFALGLLDRTYGRPLIKDPLAVLSAPWLFEQLSCEVVVLIRHPAAFVGSLVHAGWQHDFNHFLRQKTLMATLLLPFRKEIELFARQQATIVDQGILLWNIIYAVVLQYRQQYKDGWIFLKHETVSQNPLECFQTVCEQLNIQMNNKMTDAILSSTQSNDEGKALSRDAKANVKAWKSRLSEESIVQIKQKTSPIWQAYYSEDDW